MSFGPLEVLQDVVKRFDSGGIPYFLVGSLASMHYGRPRFTNDIDLVVSIHSSQVTRFEELFPLEDYYCPPAEVLKDEIARCGSFNLIHQESGIKVDVVLLKNTEFYQSEFERRKNVELLHGFHAYVASPEDVILKKLDFYREGGSMKHLDDIREILTETQIDKQYLDFWIQKFGLMEQWKRI